MKKKVLVTQSALPSIARADRKMSNVYIIQ